jgi:hypothetical protein
MDTNQIPWQQVEFPTIGALIEARAQQSHLANLTAGGVFGEDGQRWSDIEIERAVAKERGTAYTHKDYAFVVGLNCTCRYIKYVGFVRL